MQADLFQLLGAAYQQHLKSTINALDLTHDPANKGGENGLSGFISISLDTREAQEKFLARQEEAERGWHKLNDQRESLSAVRAAGFDAARAGSFKDLNPHLPMSIEHLFWYRGWCQGMNVFPVSEIPMKDVFALDRPVTEFKRRFRIDALVDGCAEKIFRAEHADVNWATLTQLAKKPYYLKAVSFLEMLMAPPAEQLPAPPST